MKALILGITGQDGSYLAEWLLEQGYDVHGMYRRSSTGNTRNIDHLQGRIELHKGDLQDGNSVSRIIKAVMPDEMYNEADQDHVGWSYDLVDYNCDVTGAAVGRVLEAVRQIKPDTRFFQPCTATMFGDAPSPQVETTPFNPQSPYACAKVLAYYLVRYYREVHGIFAVNGILYNHDSPRRSEEYLLHKICRSAVRIARGTQERLALGSLDMPVDIGYAKEYMEGAWKLLQLDAPGDYILSTGTTHTIEEYVRAAFAAAGVSPDGRVVIDETFIRPGHPPLLVGDVSKAEAAIGWKPVYTFTNLVDILVRAAEADLTREDARRKPAQAGASRAAD